MTQEPDFTVIVPVLAFDFVLHWLVLLTALV